MCPFLPHAKQSRTASTPCFFAIAACACRSVRHSCLMCQAAVPRCQLLSALQTRQSRSMGTLALTPYAPISINHQKAIYNLVYRNCKRNSNPMQCIITRMNANVSWSGSQIWDWILRTYNKEQPLKIFDVIRKRMNMRLENVPWTIYSQEVKQRFDELKTLLASTKGNLMYWWILMLWH